MEQELLQLESRLQTLKDWKNKRIAERLSFPIDPTSRTILNKDKLVFTGKTKMDITGITTDLLCVALGVRIDNEKRYLFASSPLYEFTTNFTTNVITYTGGHHNLNNGDSIAMTTTNTLPDGLDTITEYFIIERTATTFKVSETSGGSAVDIIDNGTGSHYYGNILI